MDGKHSAFILAERLINNLGLLEKIKNAQNPSEFKSELMQLAHKVVEEKENPLQTDKWIYRGVVFFLGMTVLSAVIGAIILAVVSKGAAIPEVLTALGSAAIGALAGLLAPSPAAKG